MPVGYNTAANQQLPNPTAALAGRALRLDNEAKRQAIDMAPEKLALEERRVAAAEKGIEFEGKKLQQQISEFRQEMDEKTLEAFSNASASAMEVYDADGTEEEATEAFLTALPGTISKAIRENAGEDFLINRDTANAFVMADAGDYRKKKAKGENELARDRKIADTMTTFSLSRPDAIDLVDGYLKVTSAADSQGYVTVTNLRKAASGEPGATWRMSAREAKNMGIASDVDTPRSDDSPFKDQPSPDEKQPTSGQVPMGGSMEDFYTRPIAEISQNVAPGVDISVVKDSQAIIKTTDDALGALSLLTNEDILEATGLSNMAWRGANGFWQALTFNQLGRFARQERDAAQKVALMNQKIKLGLANNPKFPVAEMKIIAGFLPNPNNVFADPEGEVINLANVKHQIYQSRENAAAAIEGRRPITVPRLATGISAQDPIPVRDLDHAKELGLVPGMWIYHNGKAKQIKEKGQ